MHRRSSRARQATRRRHPRPGYCHVIASVRQLLAGLVGTRPISLLFVYLGAATANWDVAGVDIAGRTLKLTTLAFLIAALLRSIDDHSVLGWSSTPQRYRVPIALAAGLLAWMLIRSLFTPDIVSSFGGFAAQLVPAGAPFVAIIWHRTHAAAIVRSFVYGMVASSLLAIYEFVARQRDWPWFTDYAAAIGDTPRAASLAFEAAYFAGPTFAALVVALFWWRRGINQAVLVGLLGIGLVLANARIVAVQAVVAGVVLAAIAIVMQGAERTRLLRSLGIAATIGLVALVTTWVVSPTLVERVGDRIGSIFDPAEATSNAPRLEQAERVGDVIADHPIVGIGPGRLGAEFEARGHVDDDDARDEAAFVTNNIWTQTLVDGGAIALALHVAFVVAVAARTRRDLTIPEAAVLTAWASLVLAAGLTISNFWDTEPWLLLACYISLTGRPPQPLGSPAPDRLMTAG